VILVVCYDITGDDRREDVAALLSGYGPRVQLSAFECEVADADGIAALRTALRTDRRGTLRLLDSAMTRDTRRG
jgi:CRISPR-associated protein Cas2